MDLLINIILFETVIVIGVVAVVSLFVIIGSIVEYIINGKKGTMNDKGAMNDNVQIGFVRYGNPVDGNPVENGEVKNDLC